MGQDKGALFIITLKIIKAVDVDYVSAMTLRWSITSDNANRLAFAFVFLLT